MTGIVAGVTAATMVARVMNWPTTVTSGAALMAFGFAVSLGVFFGFYPARNGGTDEPDRGAPPRVAGK